MSANHDIMITLNDATEQEILEFLERVDPTLDHPVSRFIPLGEYARKIHDKATMIFSRDGGRVTGIAAFYFNGRPQRSFLTLIAIDRGYRGRGIGKLLMEGMITYCRVNSSAGIALEVTADNTQAVRMYEKYGFAVIEKYECDIIHRPRYKMLLTL